MTTPVGPIVGRVRHLTRRRREDGRPVSGSGDVPAGNIVAAGGGTGVG